ncbi:MAG: hypothetical protein DRO06_05145, partial [Thermoproteota archaeon]
SEEEARRLALEILDRMGLREHADEHPFFLGKGERQKLAVASVLAMRPDILIVDEPTTGQDWRGSVEIMRVMEGLNREGRTVVVITHNMRLVAEYCRRAVVMLDGRVIFDGSPRELFSRDDVVERASLIPPPVTRFARSLSDYGMPGWVLTVEEALDAARKVARPRAG